MKKKKVLWICLAILLMIGGIEIFTTYRLKTNQPKQYVSDMLNIIEEIDSEMKAFSKTSMDLGERYDFKGFKDMILRVLWKIKWTRYQVGKFQKAHLKLLGTPKILFLKRLIT